MKPVLVINVVGLTSRAIGEETPALRDLARRGASAPLGAILPAVTLSAQATLLTGTLPTEHGIVGNGWYHRDLGDVSFWRHSNRLVRGEKIYERARRIDASFTCAKLFWWWNMGAQVDWSLLPKPFYPADGRKLLAIYGTPRGFETEVEEAIGVFPFFDFWGPKAGLASSEWLARAAIHTLEKSRPTLTLVYLPHLDYDLQRFGPGGPRSVAALRDVDRLVGKLVSKADDIGAETVVVSEYGIEAVDTPIPINTALRRAGLLAVRQTPVGEILDTFESRAFAVADHQIAHVYLKSEDERNAARAVLEELAGVERVLEGADKLAAGIGHERAGDFVCVARSGAWFAYPYWLSDENAPDFARTVDIHRKPGYDPCELFVDPALRAPALRVARRLAQKKLGMRYLMDVIPLDPTLVRGSHGRIPDDPEDGPVFLSSLPFDVEAASGVVDPTSFPDRLLTLLQR